MDLRASGLSVGWGWGASEEDSSVCDPPFDRMLEVIE